MSHRQQGGTRPANGPDASPGGIELSADPDRRRAWTLLVDGVAQSHVDLDEPRHLEFQYMRRFGHLVDLAAPAGEPLRVLHLGGGGLTMARYVAATRPGSRQLVVESDAALVEFVRRRLPLRQPARRAATARAGRVRIRVSDARAVAERLPAGSFDVVIADLFAGGCTPAHVTSAEFTAALARVLAAPGVCAVNVGDSPPLTHSRARVATMCAGFRHACLIADPAVLRGRRPGNLVLAGAHQELPLAGLARRVAADPFPGRLVEGGELARFVAGAGPITDAGAQPSPAPPPDLLGLAGRPSRRVRGPAVPGRCTRSTAKPPAG